MASFSINGNLVDIKQQKIYPATVKVDNGKIISIKTGVQLKDEEQTFILPGFIDSHVHIESSMLVPS
ncbi:MAG TPA: adenine deaminase, partial [Chitinophagaceae bacterium]|nr:adenine deaminase [Chitinophagaceae bacterium]